MNNLVSTYLGQLNIFIPLGSWKIWVFLSEFGKEEFKKYVPTSEKTKTIWPL